MSGATPNDRLAKVMAEAGMSRKALARAIREISERRGQPIACDHTSVSRWLGGMKPRGQGGQFIAEALSARLGRLVTAADIGMGGVGIGADLGVTYGESSQGAADVLGRLWQADLDEARVLLDAPADQSAGMSAALTWLVRDDPEPSSHRTGTVRVGMGDIAAAKTTMKAFASLDNQYGGGQARRALVQYLQSDLLALLHGRYDESTGRALYSTAAEGTLLAAWMSYDSGRHGFAQRYFIQALRLAQAANDVLLAGSVLDAMSHQATFLRRPQEAVNLARASRTGTRGRATATLTAHFFAMEARALASCGDSVGAQRALADSVKEFERRQPEDDPAWISYFDEAELSAEFGHCYRDLGKPTETIREAQLSLGGAGASPRSDFFVSMVLATGYVSSGEIEEACRVIREAILSGDQIKSRRCIDYMRGVRRLLEPFTGSSAVRELVECVAETALWESSMPVDG
ncbi:hypothetical protein AB0D32_20115 [Micromonospora sp. NPDC048170]|uniref:hypothetical protein n=1 Tax=Micromonospora sp. NPDC048170 TaxID=3154819 RepID=UPI0033EC31AA